MLSVNQLTISYGDNTVLNSLDLTLDQPGVYGLAAPNGTGKTTLLRCIGGVDKRGFKHVSTMPGKHASQPLSPSNKKAYHQQIFYYESEGMLYPSLTVWDHLKLIERLYPNSQQASRIAATLGVDAFQNKKIKELSLGMRQVTILAMALISNAPYIILDEPTNGLDPFNTDLILSEIRRYAESDKTVLFSTHHLDYLQQIADQVLMFENGKLVWVDPARESVTEAFYRLYGEGQ